MKTKRNRSYLPLEKLAEEALKKAVAKVIAEHKFTGHPLAVWKDGQVVHLSPKALRENGISTQIANSNSFPELNMMIS
jgi:hypothetical protein